MEQKNTGLNLQNKVSVKTLLEQEAVKNKIKELLKNKEQTFVTSLLSITNSNPKLNECEPNTVLMAALTATSLDLPINQNLGYAYIIPYKNNTTGTMVAQFQVGYKGLIQLAQRSGVFKTLNVTDIRQGEIKSNNIMTGEIELNFIQDRNELPVVGYLAYFKLTNGFEKILYMTVEELQKHGAKFSKTFNRSDSKWKTDFDSMAEKTVMKLLLNRFAPLSVEMTKAVESDQAVIRDIDKVEYIDNDTIKTIEGEIVKNKNQTKINFIENAKSLEELKTIEDIALKDENLKEKYNLKLNSLKNL